MDTTKKYIEMCEKAFKDIGSISLGIPVETPNLIWEKGQLYRQDELQEMVVNKDYNVWGLECAFYAWGGGTVPLQKFINGLSFSSMEQLWLAFVMKEKFNKIWNGKNWIKEK